MQYSFDVREAVEYGVPEAIMIWNFRFWILKNKANEKHQYEDKTWTYNKIEAFQELFPFWSKRQIEHLLNKLIDKNVLIKGNFNQNKHNRTCWYAFIDEDKFLSSSLIISHFTNLGNGNHKNVKSKSQNREMEETNLGNDNKETDIKPNIKPNSSCEEKKEKYYLGLIDLPKSEKEKLHMEDVLSSISYHFKINDYESSVQEFVAFYKEKIRGVFEKLPYFALKWEKKFQQDVKPSIKSPIHDILDYKPKPVEKVKIDNDNDLWRGCLDKIKSKYGDDIYKKWFSKLNFISGDDSQIEICAPTKFLRDWVKREYVDKGLKDVLGCDIKLSHVEDINISA
jgi:hypothetical protein